MNYCIVDIPGEPAFDSYNGRWQWVKVVYENGHSKRKYYHLDCDCITDDDGRCILCQARAF